MEGKRAESAPSRVPLQYFSLTNQIYLTQIISHHLTVKFLAPWREFCILGCFIHLQSKPTWKSLPWSTRNVLPCKCIHDHSLTEQSCVCLFREVSTIVSRGVYQHQSVYWAATLMIYSAVLINGLKCRKRVIRHVCDFSSAGSASGKVTKEWLPVEVGKTENSAGSWDAGTDMGRGVLG